jgi:hypothetical protein
MQRALILAGLALSIAAAPAVAQNSCAEFSRTPTVGGWSEWQSKEGKVKLAAIGTEQKDGKDLYWIEMQGAQGGPDGKGGILQVLVPAFPYEPGNIQGMVMKTEGKPAMKASDQMLGMMRSHMTDSPTAAALRDCASWTKVGDESVTVPAGTFKTVHYKDTKSSNEVWVSKDVAFGLVKGNFPEKGSGEILLVGNGTGAKSSITEKPMDMGDMMQHQ